MGGGDIVEGKWGNRLYFRYSSGPANPTDLASFNAAIATAWVAHIAPLCSTAVQLNEIDVLDITTHSGASSEASYTDAGSRAGSAIANQVAFNLEYDIARRYRGGKPRIYLPAGVTTDQYDGAKWQTSFVSTVETDFAAFITAVTAFTATTITSLGHVNLSYYQGFTNFTQPSGRERAVPKYRSPNAIHDVIEGYSGKVIYGSQRRRRTSTTI
jgi:hypothetical protein